LAIVTLLKGFGAAHVHDSGARIGGVPLGLIRRSGYRVGGLHLMVPGVLFFFSLFYGLILQGFNGLFDLLEVYLLSLEVIWKAPALLTLPIAFVLFVVDRLSFLEKLPNLFFKFFFAPLYHSIVHGLLLGNIGADLRSIQSNMPELHQSRLLAKSKDLNKEGCKSLEVSFSERTDRVIVGRSVCPNYTEGYVFTPTLLAFATNGNSDTVGIEECFNEKYL